MTQNVTAGAKVTELFGVDISGIDPETSVALTRAVLAHAEKPEPVETGRRVIITWPAPTTSGVLPIYSVAVTDADSGERILPGVKLSLVLGTDTGYEGDIIEAEVTALVNADGKILGPRESPVKSEDGEWLSTGVFRFAVAEMRIAEA